MLSSKFSTLAAGSILLFAALLLSGCGEEPEETVNQSEGMAIAPVPSEETIDEPIAAIEETEDFALDDSFEGMEGLEGLEGMGTIDGADSLGEFEEESEPLTDILESMSESADEGVETVAEGLDQAAETAEGIVEEGIEVAQEVMEDTPAVADEPQGSAVIEDDATEVVTATPEIIRNLQQALLDAGYNPGPVDGISGPRTLAALEDFQKQNNLATGQITKETLRALGVEY